MTTTDVLKDLNDRMAVLITTKLQSVIGTPEERELMLAITDMGVTGSERMIKLVEEGLTYEIWKDNLTRNPDGGLNRFENENGDMRELLEEMATTDMRGVYEAYLEQGLFKVEYLQDGINHLKARRQWALDNWAREDQQQVG